MSLLRRRLMMQQGGSPKYLYYKNNKSLGYAKLRSDYAYAEFFIPETGEHISFDTQTYAFPDNELHPVQLITSSRFGYLFAGDVDLYKFDDGFFWDFPDITEVGSMFEDNKKCIFTDVRIFEGNTNITNMDRCFKNTNIDILPQDKYGYLWERTSYGKPIAGIECFSGTPAATLFSDIIPYSWRRVL